MANSRWRVVVVLCRKLQTRGSEDDVADVEQQIHSVSVVAVDEQ
jgi:hypothetical protein